MVFNEEKPKTFRIQNAANQTQKKKPDNTEIQTIRVLSTFLLGVECFCVVVPLTNATTTNACSQRTIFFFKKKIYFPTLFILLIVREKSNTNWLKLCLQNKKKEDKFMLVFCFFFEKKLISFS